MREDSNGRIEAALRPGLAGRHAVVSNEWIREYENLTPVGRIRHGLDVTGHAGVENDFTGYGLDTPEEEPAISVPSSRTSFNALEQRVDERCYRRAFSPERSVFPAAPI